MTIKELMAKSGMKNKQFSEYFNIPLRTVHEWGKGDREPAPYLIALMEYKLKNEGLLH